jgi:hypothetical protein
MKPTKPKAKEVKKITAWAVTNTDFPFFTNEIWGINIKRRFKGVVFQPLAIFEEYKEANLAKKFSPNKGSCKIKKVTITIDK